MGIFTARPLASQLILAEHTLSDATFLVFSRGSSLRPPFSVIDRTTVWGSNFSSFFTVRASQHLNIWEHFDFFDSQLDSISIIPSIFACSQ